MLALLIASLLGAPAAVQPVQPVKPFYYYCRVRHYGDKFANVYFTRVQYDDGKTGARSKTDLYESNKQRQFAAKFDAFLKDKLNAGPGTATSNDGWAYCLSEPSLKEINARLADDLESETGFRNGATYRALNDTFPR